MAYFSKEKFIDILNAKADTALGTPKQVFLSVAKMLEELPEDDVMKVVRCKDCEHKQELDKYEKRLYIEGCVACTQISPNSDRLVMLPTDFCSYGERSDT